MVLSASAVALIVTAALGTLFVLQRNEATRQRTMTNARRLAATAERLRDAPLEYSNDTSHVDLSVQIAAEALRQVDAVGLRSVEADLALRRGLALLPERVKRLEADESNPLTSLVFATGGTIVATSGRPATTFVWNADGRLEGAPMSASPASQSVPSPDGFAVAFVQEDEAAKVADGSAKVIDLREMRTNRQLARFRTDRRIAYIAIAPLAKYVAIVDDVPSGSTQPTTLRLWALPGQTEVARLASVSFPTFSPDGAYLAGLVDRRLGIWSVDRLATGVTEPLRWFATDAAEPGLPHFSADGTRLVAGYVDSPRISVWDVADGRRIMDFEGGDEAGVAAVGPAARVVALATRYGAGYRLTMVDTAAGCALGQVVIDSRDPLIAFAPDRPELAAASTNHVDLFRVPSRCGPGTPIDGIAGAVAAAFVTKTGDLAMVSRQGDSPANGLLLQTVKGITGRVDVKGPLPAATLMKFSANAQWLAMASETQVYIVDVSTGQTRAKLIAPATLRAIEVTDDARSVVGMTDEGVRVWRDSPLREAGTVAVDEPLDPLFSAIDPRRFLFVTKTVSRSGDARTVRFLDFSSMNTDQSQPVGQDRSGFSATLCGLSADGQRLAVNARGIGVIVHDPNRGVDLGIVGDSVGQKSCHFSPDGAYVAVVPDVGIWDVASQLEVSRIEINAVDGARYQVAFSPDNHRVALISPRGELSIAPLRPRDLVAQACARLGANITTNDWQRYVGGEPRAALCPGLE